MERPVRIELPTMFGMKTVNAYLFKTPVPTLIDCGENSDESWSALNEQLEQQGISVADIERIIITHAHVDHIGMAQRIVDASSCKVWVTPLVYPWAIQLDKMKELRVGMIERTFSAFIQGDEAFQNMWEAVRSLFSSTDRFWLPIAEESIVQFELEDHLELGGRQWEIIHVPGHCANQTCFYDRANRELISADMILNITPTPVIEYDTNRADHRSRGLSELLESYDKIAALAIETVYPGHYNEMGDPTQIIQFQKNRIDQRVSQTLGFIQEGTTQFSKLLGRLYPNRISMPAANMLIGYLDLLEDQGKIKVSDGVITLNG